MAGRLLYNYWESLWTHWQRYNFKK